MPRSDAISFYHQPVAGMDVPGISPIYKLQLGIWQLRGADLQTACPLDTAEGRKSFLAWCVVHGRREYVALRELKPFWETLSRPAIIPATRWSGGITRLMQLVVFARPDLAIDSTLADEASQFSLVCWFWIFGGARELALEATDIPLWQRKYLFTEGGELSKSRFAEMVLAARSDVRNAFSLDKDPQREHLSRWLTDHAPAETSLGLLLGDALPTPEKSGIGGPKGEYQPGVNLIGYAFGELGIGEDVRMAAHALDAAGVPFTIIDFPPGGNIRQGDRSVEQWVQSTPRYATNLVCLTAMEQFRLYAERGASLFLGRHTIGYWPWELERWPANWQHCFQLVDEVWASSTHTCQAVNEFSPVPVLRMPMAVALPEISRANRKLYGLPERDYLFVFSFDGNSFIARKNPGAVVRAFRKAFPRGDESVGLVIKCMRPDPHNPVWLDIRKVARKDPRIRIIDAMLTKPEVLGLYVLCDGFVSLHRAEGFGRGIAEAILLGLDVIATAHGGNVDFCHGPSACLVPARRVPLAADDYVEAEGQFWGDPDETEAARLMGEAFERRGTPRRKRPTEARFSPATIGEQYLQRLAQLQPGLTRNRMNSACETLS